MQLPFLHKKEGRQNVYFGLFLKESRGIGYILKDQYGKVEILHKREFAYSDAWEHLTEDVDDVLCKLEQETKCHVEEVIFFLFSHLIDESTKSIKRPYLQKIKDISKNLDLKPIGYIECHEAVSAFLHQKEGMLLTSILIELDDTNIDVFVYKSGHKIRSVTVARTEDIIDDLSSAFMTVGSNTNFPSRIILYNSSDLIDESTKIITHKWATEIFVQPPRVEVMQEKDIAAGLVKVFESQKNEPNTRPQEENSKNNHEKPEEVLGFLVGEDITKQETQQPSFVINENHDIASQQKSPLMALFNRITAFISSIRLPRFSVSPIAVLAPVIFIVALFGVLFFLHKGTVSIVLPTKQIEKKITVSVPLSGGNTEIPILVATSSVTMKETKSTTGKKDIGEQAKGKVTIFNFDDTEKTFNKGTIIQIDSLQYTLDENVTVAASTLASDGSAKLPGKANVGVTAVEIGTESNIDKNKRFRIADLSTSVYFAMNDAAFTGGTKKTLRTVSTKDREDLKMALLDKAKKQQKEKSYGSQDVNITYIDELMNYEITNPHFSKEVGEEGDSLTLEANVDATFYYFENKTALALFQKESASDIPQGYELNQKDISFKLASVIKSKTSNDLLFDVSGKAVRKIDLITVINTIRGKNTSSVETYIKNEIGADDVSFEIQPHIFFLQHQLPFFKRNIVLRIVSK